MLFGSLYAYRRVAESQAELIKELASCRLVSENATTIDDLSEPEKMMMKTMLDGLQLKWRNHPLNSANFMTRLKINADDDSSSDSSGTSSSSSDADLELSKGVFDEDGRVRDRIINRKMTPEEWDKLVSKYAKKPTNVLEMDRAEYYKDRTSGKSLAVEDCESELDLLMVQRYRFVYDVY